MTSSDTERSGQPDGSPVLRLEKTLMAFDCHVPFRPKVSGGLCRRFHGEERVRAGKTEKDPDVLTAEVAPGRLFETRSVGQEGTASPRAQRPRRGLKAICCGVQAEQP